MGCDDAPGCLRIGEPRITRTSNGVTYEVDVAGLEPSIGPLWFTVSADEPDIVSPRADAALIALLVPAMRDGLDIEVEGIVSSELLHHLAHGVQRVLTIAMPFLREIRVEAARHEECDSAAAGVGTGFSAGVDSYTTLRDYHFADDTPPAYRLTHLLFNNVGSHGPGDPGRHLFRQRLSHIAPLASRMGLPLISVDSNLDDFYGSLDFDQTHSIRNAAVAFLLQDLLGTFLYSAGADFHNVSMGENAHLAVVDPVLLPMMTTRALDLRSVGGEYKRVQKTVLIAELPETWDSLDVCAEPTETGGNCSVCFKCLRTELTLEVAGLLDRYSDVFDLDLYQQVRSAHVVEILGGTEGHAREIREFANQRGYLFSRSESLQGTALRASRTVAEMIPSRARWALAHPRWAGRNLLAAMAHTNASS